MSAVPPSSGEHGGAKFRRRLSELWAGSHRTIDFSEMVATALHDTIPTHVLDADPALPTTPHPLLDQHHDQDSSPPLP